MTTTNIAAALPNWTALSMEVTKTEKEGGKAKRVPVGAVSIYIPLLAAFGITATVAKDKDGADLIEDGLPVYTEDSANWLQGSIAAQVRAQARNKLVSGTITLKDGAKIATNFEELTAEGDRTGNAAALMVIRDLKLAFAKWVATLGKSTQAQNLLNGLFGNKQALAVQSDTNKAKMQQYVEDFAATLDEAALVAGGKYLQSLLDTCKAGGEAEDF